MRIQLLFVGKTRNSVYAEALAEYGRRLGRYLDFECREIRDDKPGRRETPAAFCRRQAPRLCDEFRKSGGRRILLDEPGRQMNSLQFADFLGRELEGNRDLVFFCGGPFGYDQTVRDLAEQRLSLSSLTFPHELARLLLVEQLYRALTIIRGEPYHY